MKRSNIILICILLIWTLYHMSFLHVNDVMKIADSFAYLQMSYFFESFSQKWLWNGWFGFVYSLPISLVNIFIQNDFLSAKILNLFLLNISALLIWNISKKVLHSYFALIPVALWYLSPTFLHFNIHVLSENIYIPLFLWLFYITYWVVENPQNIKKSQIILIAIIIGLMYLTRAEAFIYIWSIGLLSIWLLGLKKISFKQFFSFWLLFFISFFIFISPYLLHLHSITGEWWLTNKWASNLRQAELRWQEKMDDSGFEQAVAELTPDNTQLIAGFAGWMDYRKPKIEWSLLKFVQKDPKDFVDRVYTNWKKLFTRNLPEIFLWKSPKLYFSEDIRFNHFFFLLFSLLPLSLLVYGIAIAYKDRRIFLVTIISFFIPAFFFFTLFFTLNRYFLIFLPFFLIFFTIWMQNIFVKKGNYWKCLSGFLLLNLVWVNALSALVYYNIESPKDEYYLLKKEAGEWLKKNYKKEKNKSELKLMERFPIVTYYSWSKNRFITPYTDDIQKIYQYALYNTIDILVVDSMDFQTYRPKLIKYLEKTPENFIKIKDFLNSKGQKVILYKVKDTPHSY